MVARSLALVLAVAAAGMSACGGASPPTATPARAQQEPTFRMEGHVGRFESTPWTFSTNSFAIPGAQGLVLVDLQFTPGEAEKLVAMSEAAMHAKTALGIVLHTNPDKFNGTETVQKHGARVLTSSEVKAAIPAVFAQRTRAFASRYAPDWPTTTPSPDAFGDATTEMDVAGTHLKLLVLGRGCSGAHVAVEWDEGGNADARHLFVGDLVGNGYHAWLELGLTDEWLARIAELQAEHPRFVHPGRGASGGPELLDEQAQYLRDVVRIVDAEKPTMPIPDGAIDRVKAKVLALYPRYDLDVFLDIGLPAVWEHRAARVHS